MQRKRYVIMMAAGCGSRMGAKIPKQFLEIGGKVILRRSIEAFIEACPDIRVVTVLSEQYIPYWEKYCMEKNFLCPQVIVKGGITRFHSVRNALEKIPAGAIVAVHDGVRPLATPEFIRNIMKKAEEVPAVVPVIPCVDTLKVLHEMNGELCSVSGRHVDRSELFGAQTPQVFHSEVLKMAYTQPYDTSFTDDASVVESAKENLSFMIGERFNIKITTKDDMDLAEAILMIRKA